MGGKAGHMLAHLWLHSVAERWGSLPSNVGQTDRESTCQTHYRCCTCGQTQATRSVQHPGICLFSLSLISMEVGIIFFGR